MGLSEGSIANELASFIRHLITALARHIHQPYYGCLSLLCTSLSLQQTDKVPMTGHHFLPLTPQVERRHRLKRFFSSVN